MYIVHLSFEVTMYGAGYDKKHGNMKRQTKKKIILINEFEGEHVP